MNHYRKNKKWWYHFIPWFFVCLSFIYLYYQIRTLPIKIYAGQTMEQKAVDLCLDLRVQIDNQRREIVDIQQRMALFQIEIAHEIEMSKTGQVPVPTLMRILKKHDATHRKIYNRLYGVPEKGK